MNLGGQVKLELTPDDLQMFAQSVVERTLATKEQEAANQTPASDEVYLTTQEVRDMLHVCEGTLITWAKRGYLTPIKIGGKKRFAKSDIVRIMNGNRQVTATEYCRRKKSTDNG